MSAPHDIRIMVTNPETLAYLHAFLGRRSAGLKQLKAFAETIGATRCRFSFDDRPFSFDGFSSHPDPTLWKKHKSGGYAIRKHVKEDSKARRDELQTEMQAIQVPGPRTLTIELFGDAFIYISESRVYFMTLDCFGGAGDSKLVISFPAEDRSTPLPEKAAAWGHVIKESEYHALREASEAAEQKVEGVAR